MCGGGGRGTDGALTDFKCLGVREEEEAGGEDGESYGWITWSESV